MFTTIIRQSALPETEAWSGDEGGNISEHLGDAGSGVSEGFVATTPAKMSDFMDALDASESESEPTMFQSLARTRFFEKTMGLQVKNAAPTSKPIQRQVTFAYREAMES